MLRFKRILQILVRPPLVLHRINSHFRAKARRANESFREKFKRRAEEEMHGGKYFMARFELDFSKQGPWALVLFFSTLSPLIADRLENWFKDKEEKEEEGEKETTETGEENAVFISEQSDETEIEAELAEPVLPSESQTIEPVAAIAPVEPVASIATIEPVQSVESIQPIESPPPPAIELPAVAIIKEENPLRSFLNQYWTQGHKLLTQRAFQRWKEEFESEDPEARQYALLIKNQMEFMTFARRVERFKGR